MASGDMFVCMKDETDGAYTVLCKNINRDPNETHEVVIIPEIKIDDSTVIECTYATVSPPKSHSHRCLLSKPIWMWGASAGSNEAGVCIGTESIYPNSNGRPQQTQHGQYLTGMDLLRLALMFGDSALDAVKIMDHYLQHYQQNGSTQWMKDSQTAYSSTYLVADYNELWIVETVNQYFVAKKYRHDAHVVSNRYTLSSPFDMISPSLRDYCDEQCIDWKHDLDIHQQFGDWKSSYFNDSDNRRCYVQNKLSEISAKRKLNISDFTAILRSHGVRYAKEEDENIDKGLLGIDICSHASYGPVRCMNTNASLICIMHKDETVLNFITGTAATCISVFKPVFVGCTIPKTLGVPFRRFRNGNFVNLSDGKQSEMTQVLDGLLKKKTDIVSTTNVLLYNQSNQKQLWWKHEVFHRLYLKYFIRNKEVNKWIKSKIKQFEQSMFKELVTEYHEFYSIHSTDHEIVSQQQQTMDKYWSQSYNLLDQMSKYIQTELELGNKANEDQGLSRFGSLIATLFNIFHSYSLFTRYLHQIQWSHWNKLSGIQISKDGVLSNNQPSVASNNVLQMFRSNSFFRWMKVMLASVWSVLLITIGWKMLN